MGEFRGDYRWGGKRGVLERKSGNISETRKDRGTVTKGLGVANPQSWGRGGRRGVGVGTEFKWRVGMSPGCVPSFGELSDRSVKKFLCCGVEFPLLCY